MSNIDYERIRAYIENDLTKEELGKLTDVLAAENNRHKRLLFCGLDVEEQLTTLANIYKLSKLVWSTIIEINRREAEEKKQNRLF